MTKLIFAITLLSSLPSWAGGINGCRGCPDCVDPTEREICMATCDINQPPAIQCRKAAKFLDLSVEGPPYRCVINGKVWWCDSAQCSKCIP